jgi:phosphatidylglycerol:prolipoprotein diacylglycerol transferase
MITLPAFHLPLIQPYGLMIVIGVLAVAGLALRDPKRARLISVDNTIELINLLILSGIAGGRIVHLITQPHTINYWYEAFFIWEGGLSVLGALCGAVTAAVYFLISKRLPFLPLLDLTASYAPLLQSIARLGCLLAGCCHGRFTMVPWAIKYTDYYCLAPIGIPLHPTQVYSALILLMLFGIIQYLHRRFNPTPGVIFGSYLVGMGSERFIVDFLRADRIFMSGHSSLSVHQLFALTIIVLGGILITYFYRSASSSVQLP